MAAMTLTELRKRLFAVFYLHKEVEGSILIAYQGMEYEVTIRPTGRSTRRAYRPRPGARRRKLNAYKLKYKECKSCKSLIVEGVCLNPACPDYQLSGFQRGAQQS